MKKAQSLYDRTFREVLAETGMPDVDPRHAEAWARCEWGTLDHLSRTDFCRLVVEMRGVLVGNPELSEQVARSYGL